MIRSAFDSIKFTDSIWIDPQHVLSVWFSRIYRVEINCGTNVDLFENQTSWLNKKYCCSECGSTNYVSYVRGLGQRSSFTHLGRPKWQLSSSHVKFDVWSYFDFLIFAVCVFPRQIWVFINVCWSRQMKENCRWPRNANFKLDGQLCRWWAQKDVSI